MRCPIQSDNPEILLDYSARKLSPERQSLLERHLLGCEECRRFADAQAAVWSALDEWEEAPVAADFDRRLYAAIDARERAPWWRRLFDGPEAISWKQVTAVATACVAMFAGIVLYSPSGNLTVPKPPVIETVELDQVEATLEDLEMLKQLSAPAAPQDI